MLTLSADPQRYLLYGAITCPFTHRVLLARASRQLEGLLPVALTRPVPGPGGWEFDPSGGQFADPLMGARTLKEVCLAADPGFAGKASVPLLWDRLDGRIVSRDSHATALALNAFPGGSGPDLYPAASTARIDRDIDSFDREFVRPIIVAGSVTTQAEYDTAIDTVFNWLDALDRRLDRRSGGQRYLGGSVPDLADLVVFTGLVRFDTCYYFGSRCHRRRVQDYPALWGYARDIYQLPGVAATVDLKAFRQSYYLTRSANRDGVVPEVPLPDFAAPHDRAS